MWASPDAGILIGLMDGHAVILSDGQIRAIPWPAAITSPYASGIPGVAW